MSDLTEEEIGALVNKVKELTKSIDREVICQSLICAAAELLIEKATCRYLGYLRDNVDNLHQLLNASIAITAHEKGFTSDEPPNPFEELKELLGLSSVNLINIKE